MGDAWSKLDLLDVLEDVISQACGACGPGGQGNLDSMALSAYTDGIRCSPLIAGCGSPVKRGVG